MLNLLFVFIGILALNYIMAETCLATNHPESEISVSVTPAATGSQLVRISLPFPEGLVLENQSLLVSDGQIAALRPLTWHPVTEDQPRSVRRGIVTFPYTFQNDTPVQFTFQPTQSVSETLPSLLVDVEVDDETITIIYKDNVTLKIRLLAPPRTSSEALRTEVVESNANFLWQRVHLPDPQWPRVIEVRSDALGGVVVIAHLQRNQPEHGRAPDFGWEVTVNTSSGSLRRKDEDIQSHSFADGNKCALFLDDSRYRLYHPTAPLKRRGQAKVQKKDDNGLIYRYWRCRADEQVPMQEAAWRRAEIVIAPADMATLTPSLEYPHTVQVDAELWDELYGTGLPMDLKETPELGELLSYHHDAIVRSALHGDDWGNITSYSDARETGSIYGMNRLNHCPPIFQEGYRSGDGRLIETAVVWCDNFYDNLSGGGQGLPEGHGITISTRRRAARRIIFTCGVPTGQ